MSATVLPRPFKSMSPLTNPILVLVRSKVGKSCARWIFLAFKSVAAWIGWDRPSSLTTPANVPPATPNLSGSSVSTAFCNRKWVERLLIGKASLRTIESALSVTSASIRSQRSVRNGTSGSTCPLLPRFSGAVFFSAVVVFLAPTSGPKSAKLSFFKLSEPTKEVRLPPVSTLIVPAISLLPIWPEKSLYSHILAWRIKRPWVVYGGVSGNTIPDMEYS